MLALGKIEDGGFIVHCQVGVIKILKIRGFWICIRLLGVWGGEEGI